jgi:hypothetical protein
VSAPLGPVVITAREIYDQLVRVVAAVERLADGLEGQRQDLRDHQVTQERVNQDHEDRLRSLERARWPLPSLAVLVSLAALALAFLKP